MNDPSYTLLNAVYSAGVTATAATASGYESMVPEHLSAALPYVVYEGVTAVRHGAKNQQGTEWVVQARVATSVEDAKAPAVIGDALMGAFIPSSIDLSADGFKVVHCTLDGIIPTRQVGTKDRWAETLYRFRYTLQEL